MLVFRLAGSGLGVTGAVIAEIAPVLLLAPLAGAVIDRLPRVRVMIVADLWRMALAAVLPMVDQDLVAVYAVAFGLAAGAVFFNPAASSVLPRHGSKCSAPSMSSRSGWSGRLRARVVNLLLRLRLLLPRTSSRTLPQPKADKFTDNYQMLSGSTVTLLGIRTVYYLGTAAGR